MGLPSLPLRGAEPQHLEVVGRVPIDPAEEVGRPLRSPPPPSRATRPSLRVGEQPLQVGETVLGGGGLRQICLRPGVGVEGRGRVGRGGRGRTGVTGTKVFHNGTNNHVSLSQKAIIDNLVSAYPRPQQPTSPASSSGGPEHPGAS